MPIMENKLDGLFAYFISRSSVQVKKLLPLEQNPTQSTWKIESWKDIKMFHPSLFYPLSIWNRTFHRLRCLPVYKENAAWQEELHTFPLDFETSNDIIKTLWTFSHEYQGREKQLMGPMVKYLYNINKWEN